MTTTHTFVRRTFARLLACSTFTLLLAACSHEDAGRGAATGGPAADSTAQAVEASASASAEQGASPRATLDHGPEVLIWGTLADNPQEEQDKLDEWGGFLDYMTEHLRDSGVEKVELTFCHSPSEMADWLAAGKVDLFDESPFGAYLVHRIGEADEPLLNRWKNGNEKFGSVIFTKADGGPRSLDALVGQRMAFRGDTSTANYFRPKVHLNALGYTLVELAGPDAPVAPGTIGYFFVWSSRDKLVETVLEGRAVAGGVSDEFVDQLLGNALGPAGSARHPSGKHAGISKDDLHILARSEPVLRRLVTARKGLDPKLVRAVEQVLLEMHESEQGRAVLAGFGPSTRFSLANTDEVAYQGILDQGEQIEREVEKFRVPPPADGAPAGER